jgi:hypothetical protein
VQHFLVCDVQHLSRESLSRENGARSHRNRCRWFAPIVAQLAAPARRLHLSPLLRFLGPLSCYTGWHPWIICVGIICVAMLRHLSELKYDEVDSTLRELCWRRPRLCDWLWSSAGAPDRGTLTPADQQPSVSSSGLGRRTPVSPPSILHEAVSVV